MRSFRLYRGVYEMSINFAYMFYYVASRFPPMPSEIWTCFIQSRLWQMLCKAIGFVFTVGAMLMFRRVGGVVKRDRMKRRR